MAPFCYLDKLPFLNAEILDCSFQILALEGRKEKNNPFIVKISGLTLL